jgi:hypothetical protein
MESLTCLSISAVVPLGSNRSGEYTELTRWNREVAGVLSLIIVLTIIESRKFVPSMRPAFDLMKWTSYDGSGADDEDDSAAVSFDAARLDEVTVTPSQATCRTLLLASSRNDANASLARRDSRASSSKPHNADADCST